MTQRSFCHKKMCTDVKSLKAQKILACLRRAFASPSRISVLPYPPRVHKTARISARVKHLASVCAAPQVAQKNIPPPCSSSRISSPGSQAAPKSRSRAGCVLPSRSLPAQPRRSCSRDERQRLARFRHGRGRQKGSIQRASEAQADSPHRCCSGCNSAWANAKPVTG